MKVVVTGGSGRVGRYVVPELAKAHRVTVLDLRRPVGHHDFIEGNVTRLEDCEHAFEGADVIVHLAAIPHPLAEDPLRVFRLNTLGTFCVAEAAARDNVRKVVFASSDAIFGFAFRKRFTLPEYLPLDEKHPLRPQDEYGLSKLVGEEICSRYSRAFDISAIFLRITWVWSPVKSAKSASGWTYETGTRNWKEIIENPDYAQHTLWAYVDARDLAQAFRLAIEKPIVGHEAFLIAANDSLSLEETRTLVDRYYPGIPEISDSLVGCSSTIDCSKAKEKLGYRPRHSWREVW